MAFYLMRFSYTPETWSKLIQNPENRRDAARAYIEQVGGTLHGFWYGFGKYDGYAIYEAPDNVSVASVVLAITAGGARTLRRRKGERTLQKRDADPALGGARDEQPQDRLSTGDLREYRKAPPGQSLPQDGGFLQGRGGASGLGERMVHHPRNRGCYRRGLAGFLHGFPAPVLLGGSLASFYRLCLGLGGGC
jgi:uncharacterized protein with GYD domain